MKQFFLSIYLVLSLTLTLTLTLIAQEKLIYTSDEYSLVGIVNNKPVYINRDIGQIYNPIVNENLIITDFKRNSLDINKKTYFINDDIMVSSFYNEKKTIITYGERKTTLDLYIPQIEVSYCAAKRMLTFPVQKGKEAMIAVHYLETDSTIILPLIGWRPQISDGYLYFSAMHVVKCGSSYSQNLYRVKISDWNNPELLVYGVEYYSWVLIPDSDILYIKELSNEITPNEYERYKNVLFNADTKTFNTIDYEGSYKITQYDGKNYFAFKAREMRSKIISPYRFVPIKLSENYPNKMKKNVIPCKGVNRYKVSDVINMSNEEKSFASTFITDELLYNADKDTLNELTKSELRILRNAFFARLGYKFKSEDLQDFFGKFAWYKELLDSNETFQLTNDDLVVSPKDKERIEMILEIENSK